MRKILLITIGLCFMALPAVAFHDGGVAHCNGCHTMHNSEDGLLVDPNSPNGNDHLLNDRNPSSICIGCHDHVDRTFPIGGDPAIPPFERGAGNFTFLIEDNLNDGHGGATNPIPGDAAGHNLVSFDNGLAADGTLTSAPGGTYSAAEFSCTSCHDPHGSTAFRFLYGAGGGRPGYPAFTAAAPTAVGLPLFGAPGSTDERNDNHTAYQGGMSAWCGNCHGDFHNNNTKLIHASGRAMGGYNNVYNTYAGSNNLFGGAQATAYLAAVPFEDAGNLTSTVSGPSGTSQVSCVTCHRAHATSAPDATRWDMSVSFLEEDGHESGSYKIPNPYSVHQRSLCNKCHRKDEFSDVRDGTPTP
jgi:hypothetical protein